MSYTDPFGGSSIQPAQVAYRAVTLIDSVVLAWPTVSVNANYLARIMEVTPDAADLTLTLPDATAASPGFDVIFTNVGSDSYTVLDNDGGTVCVVAPGDMQYLYLTSTGTAAGTWGVVQFGTLVSSVTAAALVGPGIAALNSALYNASVTNTFSADYDVAVADRTKTFVWTGGVGALNLPTAMDAGNDFFISVANNGTGALTVAASGGDTIDGNATLVLNPGESLVAHSGGVTSFYSVGRGRVSQFNFTLLSKTVSTGTVTLSTVEAQNVVQEYVGALVGNVTVVLPATVQVYYVSNQTTNAYTLTFKAPGSGTTVVVPTSNNAVLFCDGTNVINASTTISGITALSLSQGSVGSPSLSFSGDPTTGFYQPLSASVAVAISGVQQLLVNANGTTTPGKSTAGGFVPGNSELSGNVLDWYEEGTFTPTLSNATAITYTRQIGKFTRIGNQVTFSLRLTWTASTSTGSISTINGLPYAPNGAQTNWVFSFFGAVTPVPTPSTSLGLAVVPVVNGGHTNIALLLNINNLDTDIDVAGSPGDVCITGSYLV